MILEMMRKIFGCYSDQIPAIIYLDEQAERHTKVVDNSEAAEIISNIVSAVMSEKQKSFVSYVEEAMDAVTDNKFKFLKYRPACKSRKIKR
jgi:hypothetical protein